MRFTFTAYSPIEYLVAIYIGPKVVTVQSILIKKDQIIKFADMDVVIDSPKD